MDDKTKGLIDRLLELERIAQQATPGPWCVESLGEKGDGSNVIGVAFGPDDQNAERPLSGWLEPFDKDGDEIDYYRDEEVAACEHRNRNSGPNAIYIMTFDPPTVLAMIATIRALVEEIERQEKAHLGTIDRRDEAEEFAGDVYYNVIGRSPEWSNLFGYPEALAEIAGQINALKTRAKDAVVAEAELARIKSAEGLEWQPIETAPKDGSWMLLAKIVGHPDHPTSLWWACRGHWSTKWNNWNDGVEPCGLAGPTHYLLADGHGVRQSLPAAPKES